MPVKPLGKKPETLAPPEPDLSEMKAPMPIQPPDALVDDREGIDPGDRIILIIEDDPHFAEILLNISREKGFKGIVAKGGEAALSLVRQYKPDAITLDLLLPDIDGWTVLDRLKIDPETRHIPIHIISVEESRSLGLKRGAMAYMEKPVTRAALEEAFAHINTFIQSPKRHLLVVEDEKTDREFIVDLLGPENEDLRITAVESGEAAVEAFKKNHIDCIVLDLKLPGMSGFELLEEMSKDSHLSSIPVIIYTGKELTKKEKAQLEKYAREVVVKDARTPERLLAEATLFLHRIASKLPEDKRQMLERLYHADTALIGKRVLIVDDDIRNIFALTTVLERHKIEVYSAENGKAAIQLLQKTPNVEIVLMDIMMPEMDGYETMRAIRKIDKFKNLPIIALTAKAMKGDREKCIEAGASDYITKPVNTDQLLSLMRVWLYR